MPRGGRREGAGRKRGYKEKGTIEKELLREQLRQMVAAEIRPMTESQIANAKGIKYLVVRSKANGRFLRRIEKPEDMDKAMLAKDEEYLEVWAKDPSVQAFTDLLNRTIDKPAEQVLEIEHSGTLEIAWKE